MELQDYLIDRGLTKLVEEYKIKVNRHSAIDNLVCLKYSQLESPMGEKIVQQCRGIILDETNNWEIVSYPYDKFFNYGEVYAPELDWDTAKVYEKLDGSLMTLYFYKGEWRVSSSGMADAAGDVSDFGCTFAQLFWKVWRELGYELPSDTQHCYMFELMTPFNRIVVRQYGNDLILHGVRNLKTLEESNPHLWGDKYGWHVVETYPLQTLEEIIAATNKIDPMDSEGYIVCDAQFKRIKIKSPQYVAIAHLRSGFSSRRILEIVATNEGQEFLNYYPEWTDLYHKIRAKYDVLALDIEHKYNQHKDIEVQKDFANSIKHLPYSGILFDLRKGKTNSVRESLARTPIQKLESLLQIDYVDLGQ